MRLHLTFMTETGKLKDNTDLTRDRECRNITFSNQNSGFYRGTLVCHFIQHP